MESYCFQARVIILEDRNTPILLLYEFIPRDGRHRRCLLSMPVSQKLAEIASYEDAGRQDMMVSYVSQRTRLQGSRSTWKEERIKSPASSPS